MKKILALLLLVCLLCGCAKTPAQDTQPTTAATGILHSQTTVPTEAPTEDPTESSIVLEDVELEAVNVHAFRKGTETPSVAVLDHRTAAFLTTEFPDGDYTRKCTRIQIVDLHMDALITDMLLDGTYSFLPNCNAQGYFALVNPDTRDVTVLDRSLQELLSFRARSTKGAFSADLERYYYIWGSWIYCQDTATGEYSPLTMESDLAFHELLAFDPEENLLLASAYSGMYSSELCVCAVDLDTREFALLYQDATSGVLTGEGVLLEHRYTADLYADVYYGNWTDSQLRILPGFLVNNMDYAAWSISGSDYVCRVTYDAAQNVDIVDFQLFRLGETVRVCSLQESFDGARITQMYALPDGNLLALEVTRRGYRTYLICPELLEFTEIETEVTMGAALVNPELAGSFSLEDQWAMPQELAQVRQKADELEEEFGITILISGQCTQAASGSGMPITTTDEAGLRNEAGSIENALEDLEEVLELYPADFFRQFRNGAGEQGLLVLLVEEISDELDVIGVSYELGQWYPIAVDITSGEVKKTYCHEIWHATENRIGDLSESALDLAAWAECNPAGFSYTGNMTPSYIEDTRYTYFMGDSSEGVYFVDPYGKINGKEDRARLMEYVMCTELHASLILEHPAMRQKLQLLCDAIRQTFDTTQWEDVHWERFF